MLPMLRTIPLRIEYRLRVNTATPYEQRGSGHSYNQRRMNKGGGAGIYQSSSNLKSRIADQNNKVSLTTGIIIVLYYRLQVLL